MHWFHNFRRAANNTAPDTARGVAIATVVSVGTLGAIVAVSLAVGFTTQSKS